MKKLLALLLALVFCLGVFVSCNDEVPSESSSSEKEKVIIKHFYNKQEIELDEQESTLVRGFLESGYEPGRLWDCPKTYTICFDGCSIEYEFEEGLLEDGYNSRGKALSEDQREQLNAILKKHFGDSWNQVKFESQ